MFNRFRRFTHRNFLDRPNLENGKELSAAQQDYLPERLLLMLEKALNWHYQTLQYFDRKQQIQENRTSYLSGDHQSVAQPLHQKLNSETSFKLIWSQRGDELLRGQRYREAIFCYDKIIEVDPNNHFIWFKKGMALESAQRYSEAISAYNQAIQIMPDDYLTWYKRAKVLERLKQYSEALASYTKVVQLKPQHYWAWYDQGRVLELVDRSTEASLAFHQALQIKPDFRVAAEAYQRMVQQLQPAPRSETASTVPSAQSQVASAAGQNSPRMTEEGWQEKKALTWLTRALAFESSQQTEAAIAAFSQLVQLQPHDAFAWMKRAMLLEQVGCVEDALRSYDQVVRLQPDNYWVWCKRGQLLMGLQRPEEALLAYQKALKIEPYCQAAIDGCAAIATQIPTKSQSATQVAQMLQEKQVA